MTIADVAGIGSQPTIIETFTVQTQPDKKESKNQRYKVKRGDTLIKIAKKHNTTWLRLWQKNTTLTNQDKLEVGQTIIIPTKREKLPQRPLYRLPVTYTPTYKNTPTTAVYGSNTYTYRSCTWWVKNNRPNIPNNWGNASSWLYNAQSQGYATGATPKAGAVGWTSGHVVYVIAVRGNQVLIGDGNYDWNGNYKEHWVNATSYTYIY
jgi:surface antigen